jgi:hypothetical protein
MNTAISLSTSTVQGSLEDHTETTVSGAAHPATTIDTTQAGYADQEAINTALLAAIAGGASGSAYTYFEAELHGSQIKQGWAAVASVQEIRNASVNVNLFRDAIDLSLLPAGTQARVIVNVKDAFDAGVKIGVQYNAADEGNTGTGWTFLDDVALGGPSVEVATASTTAKSSWVTLSSNARGGDRYIRAVSFAGLATPVLTGAIGLVKLQLKIPVQQFSYAAHRFGWGTTLSSWTTAMGSGASLGFAGQLLEVIVNFDTPGTTDTTFQLERGVSSTPTTRTWSDLLASSLTMSANNYEQTFDVSAQNILAVRSDLFRIKIPTAKGTGASGLYVTTRWKVTG